MALNTSIISTVTRYIVYKKLNYIRIQLYSETPIWFQQKLWYFSIGQLRKTEGKLLTIKEQWDTSPHLLVQYTDAPHSSDYLPCFRLRRSESINWLWLFWVLSHLSRFLQSSAGIVHWIRPQPLHSTCFPIGRWLSCCHSMLFNVIILNCNQVNQQWKELNLFQLSVYHPKVFTKLNKMVFTSQTHLFIIVLNVLFGQHVSTRYWVIIRPLHKKYTSLIY